MSYTLRLLRSESDCRHGRGRHADNRERFDRQMIEHGYEVTVVVFELVRAFIRRPMRTTIAAQIHREHAKVPRQVRYGCLQQLDVSDLEDRCEGNPRPFGAEHCEVVTDPIALDVAVLSWANRLERIAIRHGVLIGQPAS